MCVCVHEPYQTSEQFSRQPTPLGGCYHGNLTASIFFFGPHFPFEQPANDRPADWEIWLPERAGVSCVHVHVCLWASVPWYKSRELHYTQASSRPSFVLAAGHRASRLTHLLRSILVPGRRSYVPRHRLCLSERGVMREEWGERDRGDKEALVFQETPLCQSIPGWLGSRENLRSKHIAAQQAATCACTAIYTVIRT